MEYQQINHEIPIGKAETPMQSYNRQVRGKWPPRSRAITNQGQRGFKLGPVKNTEFIP
jgi:hypothetical protein